MPTLLASVRCSRALVGEHPTGQSPVSTERRCHKEHTSPTPSHAPAAALGVPRRPCRATAFQWFACAAAMDGDGGSRIPLLGHRQVLLKELLRRIVDRELSFFSQARALSPAEPPPCGVRSSSGRPHSTGASAEP